jgi:hypothetical protein
MRFHNGLDIAGAYGEVARFIRDEKVLRPFAIENVGGLRELIRMPTLGYIHIRIGRDQNDQFFNENGPLQPFFGTSTKKLRELRIPRGTKFKAGDPIGTLNPLNHVHLIAGRSGREMNALDALALPGVADTRPPMIENVRIYNEAWQPLETPSSDKRIKIKGKVRIVARAFDQMDGNNERRRLGLYRLGYKVISSDGSAVADPGWTIRFDRNPDTDAVQLVYAPGSKSGATGETIFDYIVSNKVDGDEYSEEFFDADALPAGGYTLKVMVSDYFGNTSSRDIQVEVIK